ncbi:hypothetical protein [Flavobacterium pallidum]|uniref:Secretion system C-terminal sorting domain-containing protein n=1 Tax=Flavobacterium pallidum TaxID=2172098 RepID=A0A2S1SEM3_9FLAO|nr:hypothetical protein [Flavobacterium pallidum]AWI24841.1 hypothetical protein HYN49_02450 [Flavobacterium pallidum]
MKKYLLFLLIPIVGFSQINGSKKIGSTTTDGAQYLTLATAIAYVNTVGINGATTFLIDENQSVASALIINQYAGSAANTLTIKPNTGKNITISGSVSDGAVFQLNGADNIIIDGNNGTSDKQLTIYNTFNTADSYTNRLGIWLYNTANSNKFRNLNIQLNMLNTSIGTFSAGVYAGSGSIGSAANNSTNEVTNVTFTNVKQGVYVNGSNSSNTNWIISNNTLGSASDASKPLVGFYLNNVATYTISNNSIDGLKKPGTNGTHTYSGAAIYVEGSGSSGGTISGNTIKNIENTSGSGICFGINIVGSSANTSVSTSISGNTISTMNSTSTSDTSFGGIHAVGKNITISGNKIYSLTTAQAKLVNGIYINGDSALIYNNMIGNISSAGGGSPDSQSGYGIYIAGGASVSLYFNTVRLETTQSTGASACLFIAAGSALDIRDNIFVNAQASGSSRFCVYVADAAASTSNFTNINYNDYFSTQYIGTFGSFYTSGNLKSTLAQWKAVTTKDAQSINVSPAFTSATDLHLSSVQALLNVGTAITGITTDIDGDTRNTTPTIGADEYTSCSGGTTTWNGNSWSNGAPTITTKVNISGNYNTATNGGIVACELKVNNNNTLTITAGKVVEIQNDLTINGSIVIQDKGALVQNSDTAAVSGNISMTRTTTSVKPYDYTYFSSPVTSTTLAAAIPAAIDYNFYFNPNIYNWSAQGTDTTLTPGKGYIVRAPETLVFNPTATFNAVFAGVPNNGVVNASVTKTAACPYNLVGNPYPSAIDADLFLNNATNASKTTGIIYLWTHNTAISANNPGSETYNYLQNDYAKYNKTGSVGNAALSGGVTPTGKIAAGQGFFVELTGSNATSNIVFNNSMRVKTDNANGNFFRTATQGVTGDEVEKHRIWISISNAGGAYDETLLGYVTGATNDMDYGYDGRTFDAGNYVMIYSILDGEKLCIQGRDVNFDQHDIIPLGFKTSLTDPLTIDLSRFDGLFDGQDVYLLDKSNDTLTNLKEGGYTFTPTETGTFEDRFELHFTSAPLGVEHPVTDKNSIQVITNQAQLQLLSATDEIMAVTVYDLLGKIIYQNNKVNNLDFTATGITARNQALIVKVKTATAEITKKVMMK